MINLVSKINFLITKRQKKGILLLIFLLLVAMILEVFGLSILIPIISIILDSENLEKIPFLLTIRDYFSEFSYQNFTFLFLGAIAVGYLFNG